MLVLYVEKLPNLYCNKDVISHTSRGRPLHFISSTFAQKLQIRFLKYLKQKNRYLD